MSEKYSFDQAQNEANSIGRKAFELKKERGDDGEPSRDDYVKAEKSLQEMSQKQAIIDDEKLKKIRDGFLGEKKENNNEKIFQDNVERYSSEVGQYIEKEALANVPEIYREEYGVVLQKQFEALERKPIDQNCKLSLVLPAYKEEKVIIETLKSLENQKGIKQEEIEIIVVANYPKGEKPKISEYDEKGNKIGEHFDRTAELVEEFGKKSKIKILVIEQDFPKYYTNKKGKQEKLAGVGIASKLGMDLALMRQQNSPQVIGYYGADTIFDPNWAKECLDGFSREGVDAVRGMQKGVKLDNVVEDENGVHSLSEEEVNKISEFEKRRYRYYHRLKMAINREDVDSEKDIKKEAHGVATQTAGMYAHIGGMNIFPGGEDIANAQTISESGNIFENEKMFALAIGRIEEPRTEGGSYTRGLWNMYRALQYGEKSSDEFSFDSEGNLLVYDPENYKDRENAMNEISKALKNFYEKGVIDGILEKLFSPDDIMVMQKAKSENNGNYTEFEKEISKSLEGNFWKKLNEIYPLNFIKLKDAEEKMSGKH